MYEVGQVRLAWDGCGFPPRPPMPVSALTASFPCPTLTPCVARLSHAKRLRNTRQDETPTRPHPPNPRPSRSPLALPPSPPPSTARIHVSQGDTDSFRRASSASSYVTFYRTKSAVCWRHAQKSCNKHTESMQVWGGDPSSPVPRSTDV
jgi:hypothetical protein